MADQLDVVDEQLLVLLQEDARHTAIELAEEIGVSDNTIHNRMASLEEAGVITGYSCSVNYEAAGLPLHFHFACTAPINERSAVATEAMELPEVLEVTELMTGQRNLHIKMVGATDKDITRLATRLDELPLEINDENMVRLEHTQPLDFVSVRRLDESTD